MDALAAGGELGTNEVARRTGDQREHRLAPPRDARRRRLRRPVAANGRYRLGIRLVQLGNAVVDRLDLRELARPELEALVEAEGETATLSVAGGTRPSPSTSSRARRSCRASRSSAARASPTRPPPARCCSHSLKATRPRSSRPIQTGRSLDRRTLAAELEGIRSQGFAEAAGEREPELNAIAAPVWGAHAELTGILGLQGPAPRFGRPAMRRAVPGLVKHAAAITTGLGGTPPDTYPQSPKEPDG